MDTVVMPAVGDKIIAKFLPYITGTSDDLSLTGQTVTVDEIVGNYYAPDASGVNTYKQAVRCQFTRPNGGVLPYYVTEWDAVIEELPAPPEEIRTDATISLDAHNETVALLESRITNLQQSVDTVRREALSAIVIISDTMNEEAEMRGWCETFDGIVDTVNQRLPEWLNLTPREKEYSLTASVTVTVQISTAVMSNTLSDAIEQAEEMEKEHMISEALRYGNYTIESEDWEED